MATTRIRDETGAGEIKISFQRQADASTSESSISECFSVSSLRRTRNLEGHSDRQFFTKEIFTTHRIRGSRNINLFILERVNENLNDPDKRMLFNTIDGQIKMILPGRDIRIPFYVEGDNWNGVKRSSDEKSRLYEIATILGTYESIYRSRREEARKEMEAHEKKGKATEEEPVNLISQTPEFKLKAESISSRMAAALDIYAGLTPVVTAIIESEMERWDKMLRGEVTQAKQQ